MASETSTDTDKEIISAENGEHDVLEAVRILLNGDTETVLQLVSSDGSSLELPNSLRRVLQRAATALANEQRIAVEPFDRYISIANAAYLLNLPPSAVVSIIERQELQTVLVDGEQVLDIDDVDAWGAQHRARLHKGLDELAQMSQEMGLYDLERSE